MAARHFIDAQIGVSLCCALGVLPRWLAGGFPWTCTKRFRFAQKYFYWDIKKYPSDGAQISSAETAGVTSF